ncbi:MAG: TetR family transcriptional regulator [Streptosporangiales bacterium]|nr:TetR family transcriptional regulator [Streptosporangiales bacterium]
MSRTDAKAKRAQVRESTRQLLISTATELLRERGSAGLTMTAVARRADVAVRTVYNHFPSAEKLIVATMTAVSKRFAALRPDRTELDEMPPLELLRTFIARWYAELARIEHTLDAVMSVRGSATLDEALNEGRELRLRYLRVVLAKAEECGQLRVPLDDAVAVAYTATSYQSWVSFVPQLGLSVGEAAELATRWITGFAFRPDCAAEANGTGNN